MSKGKPRLKVTSKGWFYHLTNVRLLFGGTPNELWVGPFSTIEQAYNGARLTREWFQ